MSLYLGVDPGLAGAFAVLRVAEDGHQTIHVTPTPVLWTSIGGGRRRRYDLHALHRLLGQLPPVTFAYLEAQSARPLQGRSSIFTTGYGEGLWTALLVASSIPFAVVDPRRWRKQVGLAETTDKVARKTAVRVAACRRFPGVPLKLDHADAVMLAVAAAIEHGLIAQEVGYA